MCTGRTPWLTLTHTGGALGIGSQLVRLCHSHGAHVFFGDVLTEPAEKLVEELSVSAADSASGPAPKIYFVRTDVSDYQDNLKLFDTAYQTCGRIDHAVSAAGVGERGNIIDESLSLDSVREVSRRSVVCACERVTFGPFGTTDC